MEHKVQDSRRILNPESCAGRVARSEWHMVKRWFIFGLGDFFLNSKEEILFSEAQGELLECKDWRPRRV